MNFQKMTKNQLEEHGRTIGVELDKRKTKAKMIAELKKASAPTKAKKAPAKKAPVAKKAPAKKAPTPAPKKAVAKPAPIQPQRTLSFWERVKKFFNA